MRCLAVCLAALLAAAPAMAAPKVIASVVPVHSIVAAVMGETGTPELLLPGQRSEHRSTFTARQLASLGKADVVFIVGRGLEAKLAQLSGSEAVNGKSFTALAQAPGIRNLPIRGGGAWAAHDHGGEEEHAGEEHVEAVLAFDPHVWLDPENARAMARAAAAELSRADPANAAVYAANAAAFGIEVEQVAAEIAASLAPVRDKPFVVFHDAYQYFERYFGLNGVGAISDISAQAPSAERLKKIRDQIAATSAVCVFREPQYDDKAVTAVIEGSSARAGVLDPLGAGLELGPGAYPLLLRNLAAALKSCLAG
jgi:zinc transport system substrate-binding protein